jgi:hypothetical protein
VSGCGGVLAFDDDAAMEAGSGAHEGYQVGRVDCAPAAWADSISLNTTARPGKLTFAISGVCFVSTGQ